MSVRLALCDLGLWVGSPGFPHSAVLLYSLPRCGDVCDGFSLFRCLFVYRHPDRVDTMLSPLRSLLDVLNLANQSHSLLVLLVLCLVFCCFWFVVCLWLLCFVSVHASSTFEAFSIAYVNASSQFIFLQHAIERVKRPGESKRRCGKKGRLAIWQQQNVGFQRMRAQWP